ncbi:MAG: ABC transporter permease subunit [Alphaproteobacteria bacterium]|nr:ABC transporter permease subunit [Alphaproteobacteria bacterium]
MIFIFSLPLIKLVTFSESTLFSMHAISTLLSDEPFLHATMNSVCIAFTTTIIACTIGLILALFVGLTDTHRIHLWSFVIFLILFLPPTFLAIAWIDIGILMNHWFGIPNPMYTQIATILLLSIHLFPICFFMILDQLKRIPFHLIEAGKSYGVSPTRLLTRIILPLLRPAIVKSAMLIWFSCLGHFTFFALLGIPGQFTTLTTLIYAKLTGFGGSKIEDIVLICVLLLIIGLIGTYMLRLLGGPSWQFRTTSKKLSTNTFDSRHTQIFVYGLLTIICLSIILPMIKLLMTSFTTKGVLSFSIAHFSLENYAYILNNKNIHQAIWNSVMLATGTAIFLFFQSAIFEYGALMTKRPFFKRARIFFQSLYLMPGSILAISLILLFLKPFDWMGFLKLNTLYNTLSMIFLAYVIRFFAFHLNIVHAGSDKFSARLIESAKSCGAATYQTIHRIFLPLISPSLFNGSFLVFILIIHEVTVSALLPSSETQTIGVVLLSMMENGDTKATAALCILITSLLVLFRILAHQLTKKSTSKIYNSTSHASQSFHDTAAAS